MTTTFQTIKPHLAAALQFCRTIAQADWSAALERCCRGLAIAIAFSYAAGWLLGTWVHQSSALLGRFAAELQEPAWHQQRLQQLKARLVDHQTPSGEPQAPEAPAPQTQAPAKRSVRSKLPQPAPKPSRQRRPKNAKRTTAPAIA